MHTTTDIFLQGGEIIVIKKASARFATENVSLKSIKRRKNLASKYKNEAIRAAKDLGYDKEVVDFIKKCNDDDLISRIMRTARSNGGHLYAGKLG